MDELFLRMQELIAEKLEIDENKVTMEASFRQDLGADSLDAYELIYAMEENFAIDIPEETAYEIEIVRDAYEFIKSNGKWRISKRKVDKVGNALINATSAVTIAGGVLEIASGMGIPSGIATIGYGIGVQALKDKKKKKKI
jgi:acyl carrier protein